MFLDIPFCIKAFQCFYVPGVLFGLREPNSENVLVIQTLDGVFSNRSLLQSQYQEQCSRGSRLISSRPAQCSDSSPADTDEFGAMSAARCRIYKRSNVKVVWSFSALTITSLSLFIYLFIKLSGLFTFLH